MERLSTNEDWERALERSKESPVILYKHSSRCGGCSRYLSEMHEGVEYKNFKCPVYYVVVPESRELSDRIADDLYVEHETPQAIVIMNKRACYVADHSDISVAQISAMVEHVGQAYAELMGK